MDASNYGPGQSEAQPVQPDAPGAASTPVPQPTSRTYDTAQAVAFAIEFVGGAGRFTVAEIVPDVPGCRGRTFALPFERQKLFDWLEERQDRANIYFMLNEAVPPDQQKGSAGRPCKEDVALIRGVAVDCDPHYDPTSDDGGLAGERGRLEQQAFTWRNRDGASVIIDTGGGYQAVWLLRDALPATPENIAAVEAQSRGLAKRYGGDSIHDIPRLLRMPWTVNLPGAGKRARKRVRAPTRGKVYDDPKHLYALDDLAILAPPIDAAPRPVAAKAPEIDLGLAWEAVGDPDALPPDLAERLAKMRAERPPLDGLLNTEAAAVTDRSEHDFAIAAACIAGGLIDPAEVAAVAVAFSPYKFQEKDELHGRASAEDYLSRTVLKASARVGPQRFFHVIEDEASAEPAPHTASVSIAATSVASMWPQGFRLVTAVIDARGLPPRKAVIYPRCPCGEVTLILGAPGMSKSTLVLFDALAITTGDERILRGPNAVSPERLHLTGAALVYDAEDPPDEMAKRLAAAQSYHGVATMQHTIALWSGVGGIQLIIARRHPDTRALVEAEGAALLRQAIDRLGAVYVALGPFAGLAEGLNENDAADCNTIMQILANIAAATGACINVIHHTSKAGGTDAGEMNAGRGSSAITAKARTVVTLTSLTEADAQRYGVTVWDHVAMTFAKCSHGRKPDGSIIFRRESVPVGNGRGFGPDPRDDFELSAQQMLEAEGDRAPVLRPVAIGPSRSRETIRQRRHIAATDGAAQAVLDVLGGIGRRPLAAILPDLTARLRELNAIRGTAPNSVRSFLGSRLGGSGQPAKHDGQNVRVRLEKIGSRANDPLFAVVELATGDAASLP